MSTLDVLCVLTFTLIYLRSCMHAHAPITRRPPVRVYVRIVHRNNNFLSKNRHVLFMVLMVGFRHHFLTLSHRSRRDAVPQRVSKTRQMGERRAPDNRCRYLTSPNPVTILSTTPGKMLSRPLSNPVVHHHQSLHFPNHTFSRPRNPARQAPTPFAKTMKTRTGHHGRISASSIHYLDS